MAESSTLSFRVDAEIITELDDMSAESPASRSALAREALLTGLQHMDGVPDHVAHDAKTRQTIAEAKSDRRKGWFRSNVNDEIKRAFKNGLSPEEFRESINGYISEAEGMGEIPGEDKTFSEWIRGRLQYYTVAYRSTTYDHDPQEHPLEGFEGVEGATEWVDRAEIIAKRAQPGGRPDGAKSAEQLAITAREDGAVPPQVLERAADSDQSAGAAIVEAAAELVEQGRELTEDNEDQPELQ